MKVCGTCGNCVKLTETTKSKLVECKHWCLVFADLNLTSRDIFRMVSLKKECPFHCPKL